MSRDGAALLIRTPLRVGPATVWIDPETGTVRLGRPSRTRTLLAGLHPSSYLVATEHGAIVATIGSDEALSFSVGGGASAAIGTLPKPTWCVAIEETLPAPMRSVQNWLEVGVRGHPVTWSCSIPLGSLPRLQIGLVRHGQQMTYITRIQVTDHEAD